MLYLWGMFDPASASASHGGPVQAVLVVLLLSLGKLEQPNVSRDQPEPELLVLLL